MRGVCGVAPHKHPPLNQFEGILANLDTCNYPTREPGLALQWSQDLKQAARNWSAMAARESPALTVYSITKPRGNPSGRGVAVGSSVPGAGISSSSPTRMIGLAGSSSRRSLLNSISTKKSIPKASAIEKKESPSLTV